VVVGSCSYFVCAEEWRNWRRVGNVCVLYVVYGCNAWTSVPVQFAGQKEQMSVLREKKEQKRTVHTRFESNSRKKKDKKREDKCKKCKYRTWRES